ncbi:MAG: hypothetical protein HY432_00240 [Candidatus Liptonbacteria bacterium]|nr:hypothetical protein [Candidatus Liptonbacteria bacterium]
MLNLLLLLAFLISPILVYASVVLAVLMVFFEPDPDAPMETTYGILLQSGGGALHKDSPALCFITGEICFFVCCAVGLMSVTGALGFSVPEGGLVVQVASFCIGLIFYDSVFKEVAKSRGRELAERSYNNLRHILSS